MTRAGRLRINLTPALQELLSEYRTQTRFDSADDFVFSTERGSRDNPSNVRNRFLAAAVRQANQELRKAGHQEIGAITPHSLRLNMGNKNPRASGVFDSSG
ncbi:MAG TPA: hypothetical protein VFL89_02445, partial [Solirubrobacterales bacterium]|nr:hypothetical protein [Solirubrobacterales bacterium]